MNASGNPVEEDGEVVESKQPVRGKLLMVCMPYQGHINPTLATVRALVADGWEVTYICDPRWKRQVQASGATFVPYDDYSANPGKFERTIQAPEKADNTVLRVGRESHFDAFLYEGLLVAGKALADKLGLPSIRLYSTFCYNRDILNRLAGASKGFHLTSVLRSKKFLRLMSASTRRRGLMKTEDFISEMVDNPPTLTYTYTSRSFQIDGDSFPSEQYKFIGPSLDGREDQKPSADLASVLEKSDGKPIIYASLGTIFNTFLPFYRAVVGAFGGKDVTVILSVGHNFNRGKLGEIPSNIHIYESVDQLSVLRKASVFLTHGGMNSVNEALYYGVPLVAMPMADDQPTVAARLEELGLGVRLDKRSISAQSVDEAATKAMADRGIAERVKVMSRDMREAGGNAQVVKDLDRLLAR
ncbi:macrolide family glycosyltransferase [Bifidobacterium sp. ESL0745]|uniref:macrolide family glycosyltransferase n=1 Tax=Bifidobacterium sp. ESL0745 TaxID=2983226 RepID=UPI0023F7566A|nr:macrolide family glycosyltransferase [Bifidobacterium sp. ESL0745]MDF7665286.1 glycosyltransferase [Bifidobacterium sp. ESL0745]